MLVVHACPQDTICFSTLAYLYVILCFHVVAHSDRPHATAMRCIGCQRCYKQQCNIGIAQSKQQQMQWHHSVSGVCSSAASQWCQRWLQAVAACSTSQQQQRVLHMAIACGIQCWRRQSMQSRTARPPPQASRAPTADCQHSSWHELV